jgi:hypothetical protein
MSVLLLAAFTAADLITCRHQFLVQRQELMG